jgi:hypothetical protein
VVQLGEKTGARTAGNQDTESVTCSSVCRSNKANEMDTTVTVWDTCTRQPWVMHFPWSDSTIEHSRCQGGTIDSCSSWLLNERWKD